MKNIQDILKKKKMGAGIGAPKELDEKTIVRIFLEASKSEIKNLEDVDIREAKLKEKILYIKTAHPVVSSELVLRREKILKEANRIAGKVVVEKMFI
jgi:hypothetical protein